MTVYCFGDSNTYGYDARMLVDNRFDAKDRWVDILANETGWTTINKGMNGREIPAQGIPVPMETDLLIIMLGTNDLLQGNDVDSVTLRMERFLDQLTFPTDKILLVGPVPMQMGVWVPDAQIAERSVKLCDQYQQLAEKRHIRYVNAGDWDVSLSYDGIHYTESGHHAFAHGLIHYLNKS